MEYQTVIVYSFCWLAQCLCTLPVDVGVNCLVCRSYLSNLKMLSSSCLVLRVDQFCRFACRVHNARYSYANDLCKVMMKVCRSGIINGNCISVINTRCHLTLYKRRYSSRDCVFPKRLGVPRGIGCAPSKSWTFFWHDHWLEWRQHGLNPGLLGISRTRNH